MRGRAVGDRPTRRSAVAAILTFNPSSGAPCHLLPQGEKEPSCQHRPHHPRDGRGDGGIDLLQDDPVDPLLRGAGEVVQRAGRLGEVSAPSEKVGEAPPAIRVQNPSSPPDCKE